MAEQQQELEQPEKRYSTDLPPRDQDLLLSLGVAAQEYVRKALASQRAAMEMNEAFRELCELMEFIQNPPQADA